MLELKEADLPGNWKEVPAPFSTRDFGSNILKRAIYPIIKIPSAVIPNEFNYLLNPVHVASKDFKILNVSDFVYDVRIKFQ